MPRDGIEWMWPIQIWLSHWPKTSNNNGLMFLRNSIFQRFQNVSWHSDRHFPQQHSLRHSVLQAVSRGDVEKLEELIGQGWPIDEVVDKQGKFTALTLACHLDNLELVHFLDLLGAELNGARGHQQQSPLMAATMRWNVRVVDYLIERGADPTVTDKYGFTARRKAEMKNLKAIHSMM